MQTELFFQEDGWVVIGGIEPLFFFSKTKYASPLKNSPKGLCKLEEKEKVRQHDASVKKCWCGESH